MSVSVSSVSTINSPKPKFNSVYYDREQRKAAKDATGSELLPEK